MGYKGFCGIFLRDLCNTIDKNDKKSVYLLFSRKSDRRRREFKQTISNITLKKKNICKGQDHLAVMLTIVEASQDALKKEQGANCLIE